MVGSVSPMGASCGRKWAGSAEGEAAHSVPGRAAYAVAIEPGQQTGLGHNGCAQQMRRRIVIVIKGVVGGNGDAVGVVVHDDFYGWMGYLRMRKT